MEHVTLGAAQKRNANLLLRIELPSAFSRLRRRTCVPCRTECGFSPGELEKQVGTRKGTRNQNQPYKGPGNHKGNWHKR